MFSSTNSINPFAHLPSSSSYPPPVFINHEANDILLHHLQDPLVSHFLSTDAPNPPITEAVINMALSNNAIMRKQVIDNLNGDYHGPSSFIPSQKPVKKDRHSKIYTAQGLRDRRVRLSIKIAREFFDLQDMLGFDKASQTLEWLLTKSKTAIKEVTKMKHNCNGGSKCLSSTSECEVVSENGDLEGIVSKSNSFVGVSKEKEMKMLHKTAFHLLAKESRAKARARARERTRVKMCTRRPSEWKKCHDTSPQILNQFRSFSQFEACEQKSGCYNHNLTSSFKVVAHEVEEPSFHPLGNQAPREGVIEESIVIKRKLKPCSITPSLDNTFVVPTEVSCNNNNNNNYIPNLPQNWDINGAIARSTFCAVNLSTDFKSMANNGRHTTINAYTNMVHKH